MCRQNRHLRSCEIILFSTNHSNLDLSGPILSTYALRLVSTRWPTGQCPLKSGGYYPVGPSPRLRYIEIHKEREVAHRAVAAAFCRPRLVGHRANGKFDAYELNEWPFMCKYKCIYTFITFYVNNGPFFEKKNFPRLRGSKLGSVWMKEWMKEILIFVLILSTMFPYLYDDQVDALLYLLFCFFSKLYPYS